MLRQSDTLKPEPDRLLDQVFRVDEGAVRKDFRMEVKVKGLHNKSLLSPKSGKYESGDLGRMVNKSAWEVKVEWIPHAREKMFSTGPFVNNKKP